jgi:hypothetical protein
MEDTTALVLVLGALLVGLTLVLTMGYLNTEKERAEQARTREADAARRAATLVAEPGFFAPSPGAPSPVTLGFDDALVGRLEDHVRLEQAIVAQFVHHPSIDNLYRRPDSALRVH